MPLLAMVGEAKWELEAHAAVGHSRPSAYNGPEPP